MDVDESLGTERGRVRLKKLISSCSVELKDYNSAQKDMYSKIFEREIYDDKKAVLKKKEIKKVENEGIFGKLKRLCGCEKKEKLKL